MFFVCLINRTNNGNLVKRLNCNRNESLANRFVGKCGFSAGVIEETVGKEHKEPQHEIAMKQSASDTIVLIVWITKSVSKQFTVVSQPFENHILRF